MIKKFENKAIKKKEVKKVNKKPELINFYFPDQQRSIKSTSLEEATKKLNQSK